MRSIVGLTREQITNLPQICRLLTDQEIIYIATILGAFWQYDYKALEQGRPGLHALLKSGLHSDGFFVSRIMLESVNMKWLMSGQIAHKFRQLGMREPDRVAGIPDGATELGRQVAWRLGAEPAEIKKEDGKITLVTGITAGQTLLLVEDFCTRGTGFKETVKDIVSRQPRVKILPVEMVIINRGGLKEIEVEGVDAFKVVALAEHRINDWEPEPCPLCQADSVAIKPKATDENWRLITTAQLEEFAY